MHFKFYLLLYTHLFFIHYSNAFNITTILSQYPSFSIFNHYLSETNVSSEINSRQTITVLAVSNDDVWRLSGKQHEMLDNLMRVHVVLDYYDIEKLRNLQNGTTQMTTLFQTTGRALGQQGLLKATVSKTGNVVIGSATSGVPVGAILVNSVAAKPFNISVLHISTEIVPVGMNFPVFSDSSSSPWADSPAPSPQTSSPLPYSPRCRHKVAPPHAKSSAPSPNPHGESPHEGAPGAPSAPSGGSANAPTPAESPPLLAPKLVPSRSRSPTPSPNPPPAVESPPKNAPTRPPSANAPASTKSPPAGAPTGAPSGGSANSPSSTKSPPGGAPTSAPSANAPTSTKPPRAPKGAPMGAPTGGSTNPPLSTKSPPGSAPPSAPSGGFADTPTSTKSPPEGATPIVVAPSGSSANTPKSPPKSIERPPRSPPKLADTPAKPPPKPADTHPSGSRTSSSSLLVVVITIVLSCANLIIYPNIL